MTFAKATAIKEPADKIECPNCGKVAIVHHSDDSYRCLSCNFKRDFKDQDNQESNAIKAFFFTWFGLLVLLVIL